MALHVRLARWAEEHPHLSNALLMGGGIIFSLFFMTAGALDAGKSFWCAAVVALPLFFRRAAPVATAFAVRVLALGVLVLFNVAAIGHCMWAVPCLMYTVAVRASKKKRRTVLIAALLGCLVFALMCRRWFFVFFEDGTVLEWVLASLMFFVVSALFVIVAFLAGDLARNRWRRREQLEDRARRLEVEREQEVRIAARYAAASNPDVAAQTLETIAETARGSLTEMRKLLGVLRTDDETETKPVPQLGDIPELVQSVKAAGLPVQFAEKGTPALSTGAQLSLYRVVQEGLTNVLKHAWQASSVRVSIEHRPDFSWVEIINDGAGGNDSPRAPGAGHGLQGLRERVALYGGEMTAGPHATRSDVFVVQATIPTDIPTEDA